jgi:hypothetical protein
MKNIIELKCNIELEIRVLHVQVTKYTDIFWKLAVYRLIRRKFSLVMKYTCTFTYIQMKVFYED